MLREPSYEEFLYPLEDSAARFSQSDVPPIMCAALPHITSEYETLFDELGPLVQSQPRQLTVDHLRYLFGVLCDRFGANTWVERSGGSLLFGSLLMREFPEARVVHVYRDGRDTAVSMYRHYLFRLIVVTLKKIRNSGVDPISLMYRRKIRDYTLDEASTIYSVLELLIKNTIYSMLIFAGSVKLLGRLDTFLLAILTSRVNRQVRPSCLEVM